jgi:hypothetical protein
LAAEPSAPEPSAPEPFAPEPFAPEPFAAEPFAAEPFEAELYLRLTGERALLDRGRYQGQPWESPLDAAAHTLVAVGALSAEAAQAVVDDYHLALSYREDQDEQQHHHHLMTRRAAQPAAQADAAIGRMRAVPCGRVIEQPWGQLTISYVVLGDDATTLHVTMRPAQPLLAKPVGRVGRATLMVGRSSRVAGGGVGAHTIGPGLPGLLTLADDRGTTTTAGFAGGGGEGTEWRGRFEADSPLATETAWIEVLGERVELAGDPGAGIEVWAEPLAEQDPARRYLWARLASGAEFHGRTAVETTIETLVAVRALAADDPVIGEVRAVLEEYSSGRGGSAGRRPLPEPWRSLLARRGRSGGPVGHVVVGAVTPRFDGITAAVLAVESTEDEFSAEVQIVPSMPHWHAFGGGRIGGPMLAWWAADDRGHHYIGQQGGWHSNEAQSGGQIEFWPALDPAAGRLDIMPTGTSARAVIRVPLMWEEEQ